MWDFRAINVIPDDLHCVDSTLVINIPRVLAAGDISNVGGNEDTSPDISGCTSIGEMSVVEFVLPTIGGWD